jgi:hypothetical protein
MNRNLVRNISVGALTVGLSACGPAVHETQYYINNPQEMRARLAACERLGITQYDRDCVNAQQAAIIHSASGMGGDPWASNK